MVIKTSSGQSYSEKEIEMAAVDYAGLASLIMAGETIVDMKSTDSFDKYPCYRVRLAQLNRASKNPFISPQLRENFIKNRWQNLNAFLRRIAQPRRPKFGRSTAQLLANKISTSTKKKWQTEHNHSSEGRTRKR